MFFPDNVKSVESSDRVLEIGPGGTPHQRSDVFLELRYDDPALFKRQRGNAPELSTDKPVVYYDGGEFPFVDKEFDYVICSHVLEHVPNVELFLSELVRIGRKGYVEYPTVYYDYVYNIPEHLNFLMYRNGVVRWMKKNETHLSEFAELHFLFFSMLESETCDSFVHMNKRYFFQGFEWHNAIKHERSHFLNDFVFDRSDISFPKEEKQLLHYSIKDKVKIKLKLIIDRL